MLFPVIIAAFAAISTAHCQEVTATTTKCTTSYGLSAAPTGSTIVPGMYTVTTINNLTITSTTQETLTVTPVATTFTGVVNVTSTLTTTVSSVPAASTVLASAGFFPLLNNGGATPTPTAIGRHRRASIESRAEHVQKLKRQTPPGNYNGIIVSPDGSSQSLFRKYVHAIRCDVIVEINSTRTEVVTGLPKTEVLVPVTATAVSTSTVTVTETVLEVEPQPTEWEACQSNNVVSSIVGFGNERIFFDRVEFRQIDGLPIANSLAINSTSATNCCIACQKTPFCAGSFYIDTPLTRACHLQLTQAAPIVAPPALPASSSVAPFPLPSSNTSLPYPTASGAPYPAGNDSVALFAAASGLVASGISTLMPSATPISSSEGGMSILPVAETPTPGTISAPGAGTCSIGSLSMYMGRIRGQTEFPDDVIVSFSNGPCGRMDIDFDPVNMADVVSKRMVTIS